MTNMEVDGMTCWISRHSMVETSARLRRAITRQGMTLFGHVDHAQNAVEAGLEIPPIQLFLFGTAVAGTKLMQTAPTIGIDLPLRMLVWVDAEGGTWIGYDEPGWIAARHDARSNNDQTLSAMRRALNAVASEVAQD